MKVEIFPPGMKMGPFANMNFGAGGDMKDPAARRAAFDRIDALSKLFDVAFALPGTKIRFGIESIMRLVPGIGDAAASALSAYLLFEAHRIGVPTHIFARMCANVAIEGVVGAVPFLGDAFDVAFRANRRNVALLREHLIRDGVIDV